MDIEQILAPYRGKDVALQVDTQEDWNEIIPYLRRGASDRFRISEFTFYSPMLIFIEDIDIESYGDLKELGVCELIKFSDLKTNIYECW